ncbi:MAG: flagellar hook-associated protein FlgK [Lachnospiraceae bacterium]
MANGMGSLYVAASGLQNNQHALNTTANNLANVDTPGYVRQQVLFADRNYTTINTTTAISNQQVGLGVTIADVVHTRDIFLDKYYRSESGRQAFYQACSEATSEIETCFQELEGETFQEALIGNGNSLQDGRDGSLWAAIEELAKDPSSEVKQSLVIQKASLVLERGKAIYTGLQEYQQRLNDKISKDIDEINKIGRQIKEYNQRIQAIEAGGIETAMTLRDERDQLLDRLSALANISYKEDAKGAVTVKLEGQEFVTDANVYSIGKQVDEITGFITPYWEHLSNVQRKDYAYVFNYSTDISTELNTDVGELKALILARGDRWADYRDVEGVSADKYNNSTWDHVATGMSSVMSAQAALDQLMHHVMTSINDVFCPNKTITTDNGQTLQVWDEENAATGSDGEPHELFSRYGEERYRKQTLTVNGETKTYYVYQEESPNPENWNDKTGMYSLANCHVKEELFKNASLLPYEMKNQIGYDLGKKLAMVFTDENLTLSPNATTPCSVKGYYVAMTGAIATDGSVYQSVASGLQDTVSSISNQRQGVIGVSSDEELTNMIKYQNAFNAASRYMNVVSEMLEHLIEKLG